MASLNDVRTLCLQMPGAVERSDEFQFEVAGKGGKLRSFAHLWRERVDPKKPKVINPDVVVLTVPSLADKEEMLATRAGRVFTESHYDGYAAILVSLQAIGEQELEELIRLSWQCQANRK